jgi:hypothetical protein
MCSICGEESTRICARCTKDACDNHLCEKCRRCSDCCECEVTLSDTGRGIPATARAVIRSVNNVHPMPEPTPEPPHPPPDPDPFPEDEPQPGPAGF